ncbi:MAG TPA: GNAT family N-acetyltransferase [Clostridia bacterium]|nr:GNAT family N-acetyltransferase [Clostridia bacterium]
MHFDFAIRETSIETRRLILRPWSLADLEDFHEYASVPGVGEMAGWAHHESLDQTRKILENFIAQDHIFAVFHKDDGKVIGSLGVHDVPHDLPKIYRTWPAKEIGYGLSKAYWGSGLMAEAVLAVVRFLFRETPATLLVCVCSVANTQSRRVIEKSGFTYSRTFQRKRDLPGPLDSFEYMLKKEEGAGCP